ncbi:anti-anti-sigma factor [Mycobacterium florentinum]|uniref:Anti-sigma factor antagonist n=1 Tax=Mycobacterium florentinum TaxID=292462 RepID=A0A1X1UFW0_MYCFL|nr:anti-sigma factor antagonist [Mycobacterium florentinum]MCV7413222.1 anti-sigma factor antagonist [Mycobacterium florentinum]ORV55681.1 anti-anti-sigma factor [Mycobacterium florentinum]BBX76747.1 anti-sigma factor antagonist [Mycobacterium florentinum]
MDTAEIGILRPNNGSYLGHTPSGLRTVTKRSGSSVVVHVDGDIDASNETAWQDVLSRAAAETVAPGPFVIDVCDLDFMGSCGYAALAHEAAQCRTRGVTLRLVTRQAIMDRTIAVCGLGPLLPTYSSVETALSPVSDQG